ncbi:TetR family transcriptional regulator [Brevibacterium sp. 5221]|uniref:TetR family transcriptional regulator n=1 Tax=Brevibacterium rongguiense TaxID=2695267 RepID=A0A6N9H4E7_9MICO|nr:MULTISPECIES: TetR/AcrR family transcriptional regulator [Brevibacterium]MYM18803.1 TetR family transcriptional regulator [Brevibacterium rongguiense]WAL39875.1 TetR/AcrR family transcriptional regulator [Brevibacterium sp. BRM-1]
MPKVTEEHRAAMRRRIQDAALACIARSGFAGASMSDIVKEAGLSAGAVYVYYSGKGELAVDAGRRVMEGRLRELVEMSEAADPEPPAVVIPRLVARILGEDETAGLALQVWGEAAYDPEFAGLAREIFAEISARFEDYLRAWFARGAGLGEEAAAARAVVLAPAVMALMQGCLVQTTILGGTAAARCRASIAALLDGL